MKVILSMSDFIECYRGSYHKPITVRLIDALYLYWKFPIYPERMFITDKSNYLHTKPRPLTLPEINTWICQDIHITKHVYPINFI